MQLGAVAAILSLPGAQEEVNMEAIRAQRPQRWRRIRFVFCKDHCRYRMEIGIGRGAQCGDRLISKY